MKQIYHNIPKLDIQLVVAVPPGRTTIAHEQVLQGFVQGPITSSTMVSLEFEPATLFRNWVHEGEDGEDRQNWIVSSLIVSCKTELANHMSLKVGQRYLVADGGGGTFVVC